MESKKIIQNVKGFSQYDVPLSQRGKNSACGPTSLATILNYHYPHSESDDQWLKKWYIHSKAGWFGLSARKLMKTMRGFGFTKKARKTKFVDLYMQEINHNRPAAIKFDQWSSFKWMSKKYTYRYHWVTGVGYEKTSNDFFLLVLDHGKNKKAIRRISFVQNAPILTLVAFTPNQ
ncbi:C39 family peptidase [Jeotgalibacillus sp. ET6]|uniref:C39 family peptidase n=1 Tax=Jeotgalibacillus sp. ET6 TaxID=3037260 RepID=UPI00241867AA|nr:C39 family peptidase [Jeotgalibacillus sp. ET6]MDG5470433.1 C39 family peptidase [Jeotgalibacillus sp. ET6]